MNEPEKGELLSDVLDGYASEEEKALLLAWLKENPQEGDDIAGQVVVNGLLGVSLEEDDGESFQERLKGRLEEEENRNFIRRGTVLLRRHMRQVAFFIGPAAAIFAWLITAWLLEREGTMANPVHACWVAAVMTLCAVWWVMEPIPLGATALIPLAIFPLTGVLDERQIADSYGNYLVILFLSGFMLSRAMELSGAHRRFALGVVRLFGGGTGKRLVLGFMVATACISMWVANTVTTLMILPAALAVIDQYRSPRLSTPLLLGVAYAAALGGMGTPAGTPPNGVVMGQMDLLAEEGVLKQSFSFFDWMKVGVPIVVVMIPLAWLWLTRGPWPAAPVRIAPLGKWRKAEVRVSIVLGITAILWMTRRDPFGGWSTAIGIPGVKDSSVGLLAVIVMFLIPSGDEPGKKLLDWEHATRVPWSILILLGGGIAIGNAFVASGLSQELAAKLHLLAKLPPLAMIVTTVLMVGMITEFSSNTARATVLMPLLTAMAVGTGLPPVLLMLSASLANSCSFMLPVATPPNAIVFAVGEFTIRRMAWEGLVLKMISLAVIVAICYLELG